MGEGDESDRDVHDLTSTVVLDEPDDESPPEDNPLTRTVAMDPVAMDGGAPAADPALPFAAPDSSSESSSPAPSEKSIPGAPWSDEGEAVEVRAPSSEYTSTMAVVPDDVAAEIVVAQASVAPAAPEIPAPEPARGRPEGVGYDPTGSGLDSPSAPEDERRRRQEQVRQRAEEAKAFKSALYAGLRPRRADD